MTHPTLTHHGGATGVTGSCQRLQLAPQARLRWVQHPTPIRVQGMLLQGFHERLHHGRHPLAFENLYTVDSHEEHLQTVDYLARTGRPAVVIAASGMAAGGRVVNYIKSMLGDERHDVLFVGYQAAGTPGRAIQRHGPRGGWVQLDGQRSEIRARIHTIGGYSAHADQNDLLAFIQGIPQAPKEIGLIHGERDPREALRALIETWARANHHAVEVSVAA